MLVSDHPSTAGRLQVALDLLRAHPGAFATVRSVIDGLDHAQDPSAKDDVTAAWAALFDRAARANVEASVALYALGDPALLQAATSEIVERLDEWGLLSPETACLDLGCGIGRLELPLAARVRRVLAIDISAEMVGAARRRSAHLPNVEVRQASGRDLADIAESSFDLVLAVDVFPYITSSAANLPGAMMREAARVLRRGGRLVILNFSYGREPERDRRDVGDLAAASGLSVIRNGDTPFRLWDALAFVLTKPPSIKARGSPSASVPARAPSGRR